MTTYELLPEPPTGMTARTGDIIERAVRVMDDYGNGYDGLNECGQREQLARALADAGLLRQDPPTREEIRDELSGWAIGSGYYGTSVGIDEADEMADVVLALWEGRKR